MVDLAAVLNLQGRARRNALQAARRLGRERAQAVEASAAVAAADPSRPPQGRESTAPGRRV